VTDILRTDVTRQKQKRIVNRFSPGDQEIARRHSRERSNPVKFV